MKMKELPSNRPEAEIPTPPTEQTTFDFLEVSRYYFPSEGIIFEADLENPLGHEGRCARRDPEDIVE